MEYGILYGCLCWGRGVAFGLGAGVWVCVRGEIDGWMDGWLRGKSVGWLVECGGEEKRKGEERRGEEEKGGNDYGIAVMNEAIGTLHPAYIDGTITGEVVCFIRFILSPSFVFGSIHTFIVVHRNYPGSREPSGMID